jgi:hypothetical protein
MSGTIQASVVKDSASSTSNLTLDSSGNVTVGNNLTVTGSTTVAATTIGNLTYTGTLTGSTGILNIGSGQIYKDASGNVGIGTTVPVNSLSVGGNGITLLPSYATYLANSYYGGSPTAWRYVANGVAWGIGNNFGGVTNGVTIGVTSVNAGGAGAALTWNPAFNIDTSGNVSVGVASATEKLTVGDGFVSSRMSSGNMARFNLVNTNRSWSISNYGTQFSPNGAFVIADETAGTPRLTIDTSGIVTGTAGNLMLVQRSALSLTTQTAPEFTSIPSWVKRITVMFSVVSTNGANNITIQIGTGGAATITGYTAQTTGISQSVGSSIASTVGFPSYSNAAAYAWSGIVTISNISGNIWVASGVLGNTNTNILSSQISGAVTLSGALDYLRLISSATGSPSDQFDAGTINIQYE